MSISGFWVDNSAPDDRWCEIIARWNAEHEDIKLRTATLSEWFAQVETFDTANLPTYQVAWPDGQVTESDRLVPANLHDSAARGEVIDSTGEWVFVAAPSKQIPYRTDMLDADQFAAMRVSVTDVKDAFTIEAGGPSDSSLRAESNRR